MSFIFYLLTIFVEPKILFDSDGVPIIFTLVTIALLISVIIYLICQSGYPKSSLFFVLPTAAFIIAIFIGRSKSGWDGYGFGIVVGMVAMAFAGVIAISALVIAIKSLPNFSLSSLSYEFFLRNHTLSVFLLGILFLFINGFFYYRSNEPYFAIKHGWTSRIKAYAKKHDVNEAMQLKVFENKTFGVKPFDCAIYHDQESSILTLLELGHKLDEDDYYDLMRTYSKPIMDYLSQKIKDNEIEDHKFMQKLAIRFNNTQILQAITEAGVFKNSLNGEDGIKQLQYAAAQSDIDMLKYFWEQASEDVRKATDAEGRSLLHLASKQSGFNSVDRAARKVEFLLQSGVDIDARDNSGKTALMYSVKYKSPKLYNLLKDNKADITVADNEDHNVLYHAIYARILKDHETAVRYSTRNYRAPENWPDIMIMDALKNTELIDHYKNKRQTPLRLIMLSRNQNLYQFGKKLQDFGVNFGVDDVHIDQEIVNLEYYSLPSWFFEQYAEHILTLPHEFREGLLVSLVGIGGHYYSQDYIDLYLKAEGSMESTDWGNVLAAALRIDNIDALNTLIPIVPRKHFIDENGNNLIHQYVSLKVLNISNPTVLKLLLSHGLNKDKKNKAGITPLMIALDRNLSKELIHFLLCGDISKKYRYDQLDVDDIVDFEVVSRLVTYSIRNKSWKLSDQMLRSYERLRGVDKDNNSLLHLVVKTFASEGTTYESIGIVRDLIRAGVPYMAKNNDGETALDIAKRNNIDRKVIALLVENMLN